jgi:hypothetical protein
VKETSKQEDEMAKSGRAWKLERTVVHHAGKTRSNRYAAGDGPEPAPHSRKQYWHSGNNRYQRNPYYRPGS